MALLVVVIRRPLRYKLAHRQLRGIQQTSASSVFYLCRASFFISYTSKDRVWAHWIGVTLRDNGFVPLVHEWEIGAGENIARWMDESLAASDRLLGVFSD